MEKPEVIIYTDGACEPNPGTGGYGAVILSGDSRNKIKEGFRLTTNNRMEISAAIKALESLEQPSKVTIYSDSQYLVNSIQRKWIWNWENKRWRKAKNVDLWKILIPLITLHEVEFIWIRGHDGNVENERCDFLSIKAIEHPDLSIDEVYESLIREQKSP